MLHYKTILCIPILTFFLYRSFLGSDFWDDCLADNIRSSSTSEKSLSSVIWFRSWFTIEMGCVTIGLSSTVYTFSAFDVLAILVIKIVTSLLPSILWYVLQFVLLWFCRHSIILKLKREKNINYNIYIHSHWSSKGMLNCHVYSKTCLNPFKCHTVKPV